MTRRAGQLNACEVSSYAIGVHLAHAADVAAAEGCRAAAELLVSAVYAAFSSDSKGREHRFEDGVAA